jgi:outer membrane protein OmpA-like peptidoglycan-associated protein
MMRWIVQRAVLGVGLLLLGHGLAPRAAAAQGTQPPNKAPDALDLYFDNGSSEIRPEDRKLLDKASRLYSEGKPIVMVVAGSTDLVGSPALNLKLSQARADNVLRGLVARGIPVERFQVLAKGVSDLPVPTGANTAEPHNRRVEITWR